VKNVDLVDIELYAPIDIEGCSWILINLLQKAIQIKLFFLVKRKMEVLLGQE
jgi:hypothetical protein